MIIIHEGNNLIYLYFTGEYKLHESRNFVFFAVFSAHKIESGIMINK